MIFHAGAVRGLLASLAGMITGSFMPQFVRHPLPERPEHEFLHEHAAHPHPAAQPPHHH